MINKNSLLIYVHLLFMIGYKSEIWRDVLDYQSWTSSKQLQLGNLLMTQVAVKLMTLLFVSVYNKLTIALI